MKDNHDFQNISGMVEYKGGRKLIRQFKPESVPDKFWALSRFEKQDVAIEISFHEDEYIIETHIYFGFVDRYDVSDITHAAKKPDKRLETHYSVTNEDTISLVISDIAKALQKHSKILISRDDKLLKRATNIRNKRHEHAVRGHYSRNKNIAIEKAAKAYLDKDYRRVIELYKPYEKDLKSSDLKKYNRALASFKKNVQIS